MRRRWGSEEEEGRERRWGMRSEEGAREGGAVKRRGGRGGGAVRRKGARGGAVRRRGGRGGGAVRRRGAREGGAMRRRRWRDRIAFIDHPQISYTHVMCISSSSVLNTTSKQLKTRHFWQWLIRAWSIIQWPLPQSTYLHNPV